MTPREGCDPVNRLYYVDLESLKDGINGQFLHLSFFQTLCYPVGVSERYMKHVAGVSFKTLAKLASGLKFSLAKSEYNWLIGEKGKKPLARLASEVCIFTRQS
jgi:hypothetical protein